MTPIQQANPRPTGRPAAVDGRAAPYGGWTAGRITMVVLLLLIGAFMSVLYDARSGDGPAVRRVTDFTVFWVAGKVASMGEATILFDWPRFVGVVADLTGQPVAPDWVWRNPPTFLLVAVPLSLLPYPLAQLAWLAASVGMLAVVLRLIVPSLWVLGLVLLSPAALACAVLGQNGFLTAALFGLVMLYLDRRPVLAGFCIALLTFKPQFGVALPFLLLLSGRWRTFMAATAGTLGLMAATAAAFGPELWLAFLQSLLRSATNLDPSINGVHYFYQSVHSTVLHWGSPAWVAWLWHALVAMGAAVIAARLWRCDDPAASDMRAVATLAASMLITPFNFLYDHVALGVAAAFFARAAARTRWLRGEMALVGLACFIPGFAILGHVSAAAPAAWLIMLGMAVRRSVALKAPEAAAHPA